MQKTERKKITVLIPTYNVEDIIERCIRSVYWADEIFVVDGSKDGFSTDNTVAIAEKLGARVVQHKYVYSAKQKNWAIPQASHDWVMVVDSDEEVTPGLRNEILDLLESGEIENYDGLAIGRPELFLDKWLEWGGRYPLYNIRVFRKECRYEDRDVHAHIILPKNRVKKLKEDLLHYSNPTIEHFMSKFNRYTTYQADYMVKLVDSDKGIDIDFRKIFSHYIYLKSFVKDFWYFIPFAPFLRFFYMYFLRLGFLDGRHGFLIAVLYGFQDYVSKTKFLEIINKKPKFRISAQKFIMRRVILPGSLGKFWVKNSSDNVLEKGLSVG